MLSEEVVKDLSDALDSIFEDDSIITLACIRIDGPIFYLKHRDEKFGKNVEMNKAKLSSLTLLIKNLSLNVLW